MCCRPLALNLNVNLFEGQVEALCSTPVPSTVAVCGTVQNLRELQTSRSNRPYVTIDFTDSSGASDASVAMGLNSQLLEHGVLIWACNARQLQELDVCRC